MDISDVVDSIIQEGMLDMQMGDLLGAEAFYRLICFLVGTGARAGGYGGVTGAGASSTDKNP